MSTLMQPRVSICLPTFNGERFIAAAIESVTRQSFADFELLIIDDCSTDLTFEICARFAAIDSRITVRRNQENIGLFANYNACMAEATGEFIKPFAQDDLLHPACLTKCIELLDALPSVALVSTERQGINWEGKTLSDGDCEIPLARTYFRPNIETNGLNTISICSFPLTNYIGEPSAVMFRRSCVGTGFDTTFNHLGDIEYWLRILTDGNYCFIPQKLCSFRLHGNSATARNTRSLLFGPDLLKFGNKFSWVFEACGRSQAEYLQQAILSLSDHVHYLNRVGKLEAKEFSNRPQSIELSDKDRDNLLDFRELAVYALQALGEHRAGVLHIVQQKQKLDDNQPKIDSLENELAALLSSRSWSSTKFFRDMNAIVSSGNSGEHKKKFVYHSDETNPLQDQLNYIQYLQKAIQAVTVSRSWRLTRGLRSLKKRRAIQIERLNPAKDIIRSRHD